MNAIRCIVFDFDGVLVESNAVKRQAYYDVFRPLGLTDDQVADSIRRQPGADRYEIIADLLGQRPSEGAIDERVLRFVEEYGRACEEGIGKCKEVRGASETLRVLSLEYSLYVNSATPESPLNRLVHARGWAEHFRGVFGRPASKVENLNRVMEFEGLAPGHVAFVGDRMLDFVAAQRTGCVFVGRDSDESDFDPAPPMTVRDLVELRSLFTPPTED